MWSQAEALESMPRDALLFVSFSNSHYSDFMVNWSKHLKILQVWLSCSGSLQLFNLCSADTPLPSAHCMMLHSGRSRCVRCHAALQMMHIVVPFDSKTEELCRQHDIVLMPYDTKLEAA